MKNITVIILSVVLVAAIISGFIVYGKYVDKKDALLISDKKVTQMEDQIQKDAKSLEELKGAKVRISEFKEAIKTKDQTISEVEEKVLK